MKCPKDQTDMEDLFIDGVEIESCKRCAGLWLDWGELRKLAGTYANENELIYRGKSEINCPRCGKRMNQADLHSVIVDECTKDGLFFDEGELEKVLGRKLDLAGSLIRVDVSAQDLKALLEKGTIKVGRFELSLRR